MNNQRVIFMGTPDYAVPALQQLASMPGVSVDLVVTQPDRPQGRGKRLQSPPVKLAADELGLSTLQVSTLKGPETRQLLEEVAPDLIVVAAFGIILGPKTLGLPRVGCVNLHASILPKFRGANPIAAAIASGDQSTGVTLMGMDRGLDTGPAYASAECAIDPEDTTATLTERLAVLGADLLRDNLAALLDGSLRADPQPQGATLTRPMTKDDGWIDWSQPASAIDCHVRAMEPWPRAWTTLVDGTRLQVQAVAIAAAGDESGSAGQISIDRNDVHISSGSGNIRLIRAQLPGGKPLEGHALVQRLRQFDGTSLGTMGVPEPLAPLVVPVT